VSENEEEEYKGSLMSFEDVEYPCLMKICKK
jgi:hypothetical protein